MAEPFPASLAQRTLRDAALEAALRGVARMCVITGIKSPFRAAASLVRALASTGAECSVPVGNESRFSFPLGDKYWSRAFFVKRGYELEIENFLKLFSAVDFDFIDCGANFGYWSVVVSDGCYGKHSVVAIEADKTNMQLLMKNRSINQNRFAALHRAVFDRSGIALNVSGSDHHSLQVTGVVETNETASFAVQSISLDDCLKALPAKTGMRKIVLKLDVEGVESQAMAGASNLMLHDTVILYEDGRNDREHQSSHTMQDVLGLKLFALDKDKKPTPVQSIADVALSKARGIVNFAAVKPHGYWDGAITHLNSKPESHV